MCHIRRRIHVSPASLLANLCTIYIYIYMHIYNIQYTCTPLADLCTIYTCMYVCIYIGESVVYWYSI
jgi:hypothetical protein